MVVLRATRKVLKSLAESAVDADSSDTALGDWYANRVVIDRQPLLLLVSSTSLLSVVSPARDVKNLPGRLPELVDGRLRRLGVPDFVVSQEVLKMHEVRVGRTTDRSVTGQMVDFAKAMQYSLPVDGWTDSDLYHVEDRLGETPCRLKAKPITWPERDAVQMLFERWG